MKTNCIICDTEVENWNGAYPENPSTVHPIGGTVFRTYGHYGSTVFDPMSAEFMEIVLCDPCLKDRLSNTHRGVNEKYQMELEQKRKEQDELLRQVLGDDIRHDLPEEIDHASKEYNQWMAEVWRKNQQRNSNV